MILDGKYIEQNSIPLDRLDTSVPTTEVYRDDMEAVNNEIGRIKNLTNDSNTVPLQAFYTKTVNHFATQINDTSTATDPAHTIRNDSITNAMLNSGLKNVIVYTNVANDSGNPITTYKEFTAAAKITSSSSTAALTLAANSATNNALTVTTGVTNLAKTNVSGALAVTGATTMSSTLTVSGATTVQNLTVNGNMTIVGNTTNLNQSVLNITDRQVVIAKGAPDSIAVSTGTDQPGVVIDLGGYVGTTNTTNQKKTPKLIYCKDLFTPATNTGWSVVDYNNNGLIRPLATKAYVDAQITAAGNDSSGAVGTVKKAIAVGQATLAANTKKIEVTLPTDFDSRGTYTKYVVFVQPCQENNATMGAGITRLGEVWINKMANKFAINVSGAPANAVVFSWIAISLNYSGSTWATPHTLLSGL